MRYIPKSIRGWSPVLIAGLVFWWVGAKNNPPNDEWVTTVWHWVIVVICVAVVIAVGIFLKLYSGRLFGWLNDPESLWGKFKKIRGEGALLAQKRWALYSAIAIATILLAYVMPNDWSATTRYTIIGIFVLLGLHIVWLFFTDTTSTITKVLVSVFLTLCVVAFIVPNTADRIWRTSREALKDYDQDVDSVVVAPKQSVLVVPPIILTSEWSEEIPLPAGKTIRYYCSQPGAEMAVVYDRAQSMSVESGQVFPCPTQDESPPILGTNVVHARYVFRKTDGEGDITATVTSS
jgi:hypothetical protein